MTQNLKFNAGEVIVLTIGEYSDFGISGFLVSIKPFDMAECAQEFAKGKERYSTSISDLITWLVVNEYAIPVTYRETHLGGYSGFGSEFNVKWEDDE